MPEQIERATCRFCLNSRNSRSNPLIEPCDCKGSLRHVHLSCLNKWILLNPNRNNKDCELCLTPYLIIEHPALEVVPSHQTYTVFILRFPFVLSLFVHYIWLVHASILDTTGKEIDLDPKLYTAYQWIFQIIYFGLLGTEWQVKNTALYFRNLAKIDTCLFFLIQVSLLLGVHSNYFIAGPVMNLYVSTFWHWHIQTLHRVNVLLLNDQS